LAGALSFATSAAPSSPVGSYPVTPQGVSSPNYTISFAAGTLTVVRASTIAVAASPNRDGLNKAVTLTALVSAVAPGAGQPTGVVRFFDGGTLLGVASLVGGRACSGRARRRSFSPSTESPRAGRRARGEMR
jgi:hypothetical protein